MGLTRQYLRYAAGPVFGVIASPKANVAFVTLRGGERARYAAVGACEQVFVWDLRTAEKVLVLEGKKHAVTCLRPSPDGVHLAVGYEDGSIRVFSLRSGDSHVSFNGHKSAVSVIRYDDLGARLVSGSRDTDVIVWDVINECGLYRLRGHKDDVTQALFLNKKNLLVTSSKDSFVKWWDLDTQHCFKTMVGHRSEVWGMVLLNQENRLLTGSADSELRAWDISYLEEAKEVDEPQEKKKKSLDDDDDKNEDEGPNETPEERILGCKKVGSVLREGRDRVVSLTTDPRSNIIVCHGLDATLEIFSVIPEEEVQKKMEQRLNKARKKARAEGGTGEVKRKLSDEIQRLTSIKASFKIRSLDCLLSPQGEMKMVLLLQNNTVETYTLKTKEDNPVPNKTSHLTLGGHRTDVRTLAFSSDNIALLSASAETAKVWNRATLQVVRTMECEYALCSLFVPGDRQIIIGTKSGKLQIFDLASGSLLETIDAHQGATWAVCLSPDQRGIVTGGADKTVKFWDFELIKDKKLGPNKRLTAKHTRTLQLDEDVLCVRYSPDQRLLAVSLLDCTVKIFYTDTLKFFLSLYGHKFPVLCLDISHDSTLIATGSADRNVKVWGLDFGDCHRSMFAHDDSVMFLQFVPKTHLFFTAGKDRKIKQWDADKFEHIQTLEGHHGEVWCVAVSPNGDYVASSAHDKSLRLWQRSREPIILDEEKEMEREAEFEETLANGDEPVVPGEARGEAELAGRKTVETVKAAERIMEALELYREESRKLQEHKAACEEAGKELPSPKMSPILVACGSISPSRYVLDVIRKVRSSELEVSLLVLPFSYVPDLLTLFSTHLQQGLEVELVCRCLFYLLRIHFGRITSNQMLLSVIDDLRTHTITKVREIRDLLGFNSAGLQFLQRETESRENMMFFTAAADTFKEKKKKKKRKRERAVLTVT
ncbi:WD repeat-containing protein 3 isoform X1 [Electrophorus electricus]|uniref:WD repeat-containing protein 3 n=2 Tax=Electrophorus electricus TaxID=8005 RepID=A0A4W4F4E4_ELEEL|nr:WD repeat-containing protein 3 isoform X1 [Electrophorus electricus]XP_035378952.1 WD repeat-containing protein 3 isoform X1 [Electrophorus electricus]